jgi:hypothetical protein
MGFGALFVAALLGTAASPVVGGAGAPPTGAVSVLASREIPPLYLNLYRQAGEHYGIDWAVLAGIGKVECDHGQDPDPSCTKEGAVNSAGAGGPMQFLAGTWAEYGVDADGDGRIDRWDPADAIWSAANYLRAAGAPGDYARALFAYNHASWYVREVESWAARYRGSSAPVSSSMTEQLREAPDTALQQETATPVEFIDGEHAQLAPGNGHVALLPAGVELQELPYGPAGHPDPRGAAQEDCSSSVNYVLGQGHHSQRPGDPRPGGRHRRRSEPRRLPGPAGGAPDRSEGRGPLLIAPGELGIGHLCRGRHLRIRLTAARRAADAP